MKNFIIILYTAIGITILSSCEKTEKVDDFPVHKSQLVTNCFFSPDSCFIFNLSKSLSPLDNAPFRTLNSSSAYIRVFEDNVFFDSFRYDGSAGNFHGNPALHPTVGKKYRFDCFYPGFPKVSAEDYIPDSAVVKKSSLYTTVTGAYNSNDTVIYGSYTVNLNIDLDQVKPSKYVIVTISYNFYTNPGPFPGYYNTYVLDMKDLNSQNEQAFANGSLYLSNENGLSHLALQWESTSGYLYKNKKTATLLIQIKTCSANAFQYLKRSALQYENADDPFSEPTPVSNNIVNGFGVFGGWNQSKLVVSY